MKTMLWALPKNCTQLAEANTHVQWDPNGFEYIKNNDGTFTKTLMPLSHIPNSFAGDRHMKTWYIFLTNFKFNGVVPESLTGIQVNIRMDRGGRVMDDTVQLRLNNQWIGENRATVDLDMSKVYGGPRDNWGIEIKPELLTDPTFGIGVRFRTHVLFPHRTTPLIDSIRIRFIDGTILNENEKPSDGDGEGDPAIGGSRIPGFLSGSGSGRDPGKGVGGAGTGSFDPTVGDNESGTGTSNFVGSGVGYAGSGTYIGSIAYTGSASNGYTSSKGPEIPL